MTYNIDQFPLLKTYPLKKKKDVPIFTMIIWKHKLDAQLNLGGRRHDHDRMVVGFITTYAISAYHH